MNISYLAGSEKSPSPPCCRHHQPSRPHRLASHTARFAISNTPHRQAAVGSHHTRPKLRCLQIITSETVPDNPDRDHKPAQLKLID